jgi:hypothetical protein
MIHRIDHLVIIFPDLQKAVADAAQAGFTVVPGGTHADGVTHNALIAFADGSYIELIAPVEGTEGKSHRWFPRLTAGGGLVDLCLGSDDLVADVREIANRGRDYSAPVENGRLRPDGVELRWKGSMPPGPVGGTGWPFLIEDVSPREHRVPGDPAAVTHANGAIGIAGVTVLANDLAGVTGDFEAITGRDARTMTSPMEDTPLATFINFEHSWLMITQPTAGQALVHLEHYGQGPYAAVLRTHEGPITPGSGKTIDPKLLGGAHIELN